MELAESLYGLGKLLATEGHYVEAKRDLREALKLQREIYDGSDAAIARTLKDLARVMADDGDLNSAIPLMRSAVAMQRELRGNEPHPDLAEALNDMGVLLWQHGDFDETEKFYRESLAMKRRLLGDKHPEIAAGLENLAMSLTDKGDLAGAEPLYRQSLEMRRELGIPHSLAAIGVTADKAEIIGREAAIDPSAGGNPLALNPVILERIFRAAVDGKLAAVGSPA